jgi:amino acid transporter
MTKTSEQNQLRADSLGLTESTIMGVAGTAPAFSIAATTSTLFATVGSMATASILYCGIIMFGIALAFFHLNRVKASAGTSYSWVREIFDPTLGFFTGWALLVATTIFMVSGTIPAATGLLSFMNDEAPKQPTTVMFCAACLLLFVGFIVVKGIKVASYVQTILTVIEVGILVLAIASVLWYFKDNPVQAFEISKLSFTAFSPATFALGSLTALFFFWGWDVTLNLSEETTHSASNPGKGALWSMIIVLLIFTSFTVATQMAMTSAEIEAAGTNIVLALAEKVFPRPYSYLVVLSVLLSTLGTLETTILQFTRTLFAKGRDRVLHARYAKLHPTWQTPVIATTVIVGVGLVLLFASSFSPTVTEVIDVSVKSIGFQVCFYYGLTGFACSWHFRREAFQSSRNFFTWFLWPLLSAFFISFIGVYSALTFDTLTTVIGLGGIAIGIIPYTLNRLNICGNTRS